ncbi:MAG: PleD family two-component system response regulator [Acidovorax sp.]|jgi:DNA-binding response OmpR family regulator
MSIFDRLLGSVRKSTGRTEAIDATPAAWQDRRQRTRSNARSGTRVLIIDDSPTVVAVLRKTLRSAGYETREALDAEHGLSLIAQDPPELIFLDIILPGMNGFNALRAIRKMPAWQHIPVIMISGNEHATEQFYANRIGADDFMKKPFLRHEIFARIEALLDADQIPRRKGESSPTASS